MSCPDCFKGSDHQSHGTPQGQMTTLHGIPTYIAGPPSNTTTTSTTTTNPSTIIYLPDALGLRLSNNHLLADHYAITTGCRVLFPDIIPGGGISPSILHHMDTIFAPISYYYNPFSYISKGWSMIMAIIYFITFMIQGKPPNAMPEILRYARAVKAEISPKGGKLGVCGFCWGGYGSTVLCAEPAVEGGEEALIDAQFCAHPSFLKMPDMIVDAITKFKVPYSVAVAELDHMFNPKRAEEVEAILRERVGVSGGEGGCEYEFVVHKGCRHGFAVRANPYVKEEFQALEVARDQAVRWFKKHLV